MTLDRFIECAERVVMGPTIVLFILSVGCFLFIGIPYGIYKWATYSPPETFELRVNEWTCTDGYTHKYRVCTKTCSNRSHYVCIKWERK